MTREEEETLAAKLAATIITAREYAELAADSVRDGNHVGARGEARLAAREALSLPPRYLRLIADMMLSDAST